MNPLSVVADASPLIALADIGLLDRCESLFGSCVIPPAVANEIAGSVRRPRWMDVRRLDGPIDPRIPGSRLDRGEMEVIALAPALGYSQVLIDERTARRVAVSLGLSVIGTVGLLVRAKQQGILPTIRPSLDALRETGFFLGEDVIEVALRGAGEAP